MVPSRRYSTLRLVGRSLLPSSISVVFCVGFGILLIMVHCLLLSVSAGTALPELLDGQWATFYTNTIVQPIDVLLNDVTFNDILSILLWCAIGLVVFSVSEFLFRLYRQGREATHDVQLNGTRIVQHPARHEFLVTVAWRAGVLVVTLLVLLLLHPLPENLLASDTKLVAGDYALAQSLWRIGLAIVAWTVLAHCFVIFLRLFLMRTRLFGDEHIE